MGREAPRLARPLDRRFDAGGFLDIGWALPDMAKQYKHDIQLDARIYVCT